MEHVSDLSFEPTAPRYYGSDVMTWTHGACPITPAPLQWVTPVAASVAQPPLGQDQVASPAHHEVASVSWAPADQAQCAPPVDERPPPGPPPLPSAQADRFQPPPARQDSTVAVTVHPQNLRAQHGQCRNHVTLTVKRARRLTLHPQAQAHLLALQLDCPSPRHLTLDHRWAPCLSTWSAPRTGYMHLPSKARRLTRGLRR